MPPNILPRRSDFSAGHFAGWFFTLYAGVLVVSIALIWALWTGFKNRNWLAYFSVGWVHILALNSTLPTAAKWVATTIMMAGFILYIRGIAYFVAVPPEDAIHWHFGHLLVYRLFAFLPPVRQPMLDDEARHRAAKDGTAQREPAGAT